MVLLEKKSWMTVTVSGGGVAGLSNIKTKQKRRQVSRKHENHPNQKADQISVILTDTLCYNDRYLML
jgi:hypothetical protein